MYSSQVCIQASLSYPYDVSFFTHGSSLAYSMCRRASGPNGAGKTSMFRVMAGLWKAENGNVSVCGRSMSWCPQRPYLVMGTLRDQVVYPQSIGFDTRDDAVSMTWWW